MRLGVFLLCFIPVLVLGGERVFPLDPVKLAEGREVAGNSRFLVEHEGMVYHFVDSKSRETFLANPSRFEVQMGGACARMGPLRGELGNPEIYTHHGEQLFIFGSTRCREVFLSDPSRAFDPDSPRPQASREAMLEGKRWIAAAVDAMGGAKALDGVGNQVLRSTTADGRERMLVSLFPDRVRLEEEKGGHSWGLVVGPEGASRLADGHIVPAHDSHVRAFWRWLGHQPLHILKSRHQPDFVAYSDGTIEQVGGVSVVWVQTWSAGVANTLGIDVETGRLAVLRYRGRGTQAQFGQLEKHFHEFREIDGLMLPFQTKVYYQGEPLPSHDETLTYAGLNERIDPKKFRVSEAN